MLEVELRYRPLRSRRSAGFFRHEYRREPAVEPQGLTSSAIACETGAMRRELVDDTADASRQAAEEARRHAAPFSYRRSDSLPARASVCVF